MSLKGMGDAFNYNSYSPIISQLDGANAINVGGHQIIYLPMGYKDTYIRKSYILRWQNL